MRQDKFAWISHAEWLIMMITLFGFFYMMHSETSAANSRIDATNARFDQFMIAHHQDMIAHHQEMKDFHGRMCAIEERYREKR